MPSPQRWADDPVHKARRQRTQRYYARLTRAGRATIGVVMVDGRAAAILHWYASHARDLPWRRPDAGPWAVLVSEIMLQQTPVSRVLPAYEAWLARWPTPSALAAASPA